MPAVFKWIVPSLLAGACLAECGSTSAQEEIIQRQEFAVERDDSMYRDVPPAYSPDTRALIIQKAQVRAEQRQARLASMSWYGMSNSRPTGAPTPFTSRYGPAWEMPGGRPFAWYPYARPGYVMYWR